MKIVDSMVVSQSVPPFGSRMPPVSYPILTFPDVLQVAIDRPTERPWVAGGRTAAVVPSAFANAIHDANGARVRSVPFTPDKVLAALKAR